MVLSQDSSQENSEVSSSVHCLWLPSTRGVMLALIAVMWGALWGMVVAALGLWLSLATAGRPGFRREEGAMLLVHSIQWLALRTPGGWVGRKTIK